MARPSEEREREIAELAETLADMSFPSSKIWPKRILDSEGITYSFGRYQDAFDGLLEYDGRCFHVYCNKDRHDDPRGPRARFTLAHELGHYFIDEHRQALVSGQASSHSSFPLQSKQLAEREADLFASNLLMPTRRFKRALAEVDAGAPGIVSLADKFGASWESTAIRYTRLDSIPVTILRWGPKGHKWSLSSPSMRAKRLRSTIRTVEAIPEGSATALMLAGRSPKDRHHLQVGSVASAWFAGVWGHISETILIEQVLEMGRFGVLTVLFPAAGKL